MRYRLYHDPSTSNTATFFTDTLDEYSQDAAVSINSEDNDIQFKARSTTRLRMHNANSNAPGRIDLNIGDLTAAPHTTHGELRFCRGDDPSIRYHSIITKHSHVASRCALLFKIHDSTVSSDNTGQREVLKLQSDGNCGINLDGGDPTETLEVNGTVKCAELKFEDVGGVTTHLSSVISDLLLRVAELEDRFGIDITTGVNWVHKRHARSDYHTCLGPVLSNNRFGRATVHNRRNTNGNQRGDCDAGKCPKRNYNYRGVQW